MERDLFSNLPQMTQDEKMINALLQTHQGEDEAASSLVLASQTGLDRGHVRHVIRRLVRVFKKRIAACSKGYFVVETETEWQTYLDSLWRRAMAILGRWADAKGIALKDALRMAGQGLLPLEAGEEVNECKQ